jgi:hypothetical protein
MSDLSFFARVLARAAHILPLQIQAQLGQVKQLSIIHPRCMKLSKGRKPRCRLQIASTIFAIMRQKYNCAPR